MAFRSHVAGSSQRTTADSPRLHPSIRRAGITRRPLQAPPAASTSKPPAAEVPDVTFSFVSQYQGAFRALPLYAGGMGIIGVLVNRVLEGVSAERQRAFLRGSMGTSHVSGLGGGTYTGWGGAALRGSTGPPSPHVHASRATISLVGGEQQAAGKQAARGWSWDGRASRQALGCNHQLCASPQVHASSPPLPSPDPGGASG